jgi:hypothetical protein
MVKVFCGRTRGLQKQFGDRNVETRKRPLHISTLVRGHFQNFARI